MCIKYIKGDLLQSNCQLLCHGVNCSGGFGSGLAGQIAKKYPRVRELYYKKYNYEGWQLGEVQFVRIKNSLFIANCATQKYYGRGVQQYVDYNAIETCLREVFSFANENQLSVGLPKIGCGLGGGDWLIVKELINKLSVIYNRLDIVVYE